MKIPVVTGIIRRRILLNYRLDPGVAERILPSNFRPKLVQGYAVAGICLIRLEQIRPKGLPGFAGISSENSAHRIAVEWEDDAGVAREGVFVPRRDTDSRLNSILGGRVFPGVQHYSEFRVTDLDGRIAMRIESSSGDVPLIDIEVEESEQFPETSVFGSLGRSSRFFEAGCVGYSSRPDSCIMDGMLLKVPAWQVAPLFVHRIRSAYYDDASIFPPGSIEFDHALLMRDIAHEWHSEPEMVAHRETVISETDSARGTTQYHGEDNQH